MADAIGNKAAHNYHLDVPAPEQGFFAKGLGHGDWGAKNRLSHLFNPKSGNTVMLAFDHGYIMGPTAGLERIDVTIAPLCQYTDVLMGTRGTIRSCIPPTVPNPICLRATHDASVLVDDMSSGSGLGADIEAAIRMNASAIAMQCFVGGAGETQSLELLCRAVDAGERYGIPVLGVTAVGKEMARTTQYFLLATRMLAELGASFVKTYYCDDFEKVVAACPVPIVIAGGKKLPEDEALTMAYRAISDGAGAWTWAATSSRVSIPPPCAGRWPRSCTRNLLTGRPSSSIRSWPPRITDRRFSMAAEYMHIGIPVLNKKPNMVYNEWGGFWVNESVDAYDYKIEYLKFEEGTRFPEILSKQPHVAYKVDNMDPYLKEAQQVIFGPETLSDTVRLAFITLDDAIIELYEET